MVTVHAKKENSTCSKYTVVKNTEIPTIINHYIVQAVVQNLTEIGLSNVAREIEEGRLSTRCMPFPTCKQQYPPPPSFGEGKNRKWPEKWASKWSDVVHVLVQWSAERGWWWSCYCILCIRHLHLYLPSCRSAAGLWTQPAPCDLAPKDRTSWTASSSTPNDLYLDYTCTCQHQPTVNI